MRIKNFLVKIHWFSSSQLGLNFIVFTRSILNFPHYLLDFWAFRRSYVGKMTLMPCLHDRHEEAGSTKNEYFWQDLLVARAIYDANPTKHVDIGSRIDGFVAHIASFRECEVFDFRSISTVVPGIVFRQADLMRLDTFPEMSGDGYCDSLSCLHAIEHFGLGRYGDPIDPTGYRQGITNMAQLLRSNGTFYLSTPIGNERVEFNANWVFDPRSILHLCEGLGLKLQKMMTISATGFFEIININDEIIEELSLPEYQLCLFVFKKIDRM